MPPETPNPNATEHERKEKKKFNFFFRKLGYHSRRYHVMNYHDTMAICKVYGPPDLFLTFTCNPKWREIANALRFEPGQQPGDRSDLVVRVFHMKVDEFIADIR
jgi:hypothetical protein